MLGFTNGDPTQAGEVTPPATPRQSTGLQSHTASRREDSTTPTRANFGSLPPKRSLPTEPHQTTPSADTSQDVSMNGSDESRDQSDNESATADNDDPGKKKKSQRFYCVDYPPCALSFTRSEHLARHIRKHTGERPFQCHCSRRFSRLDNLRQHAQTVHVNEDIPIDSLAATGSRFQRQVRTDRVRPPGGRSRPTTAGAPAGPIRGHQRNSLSASSISSIGSVYGMREDARRRPAPLVMTGGNRPPGDGMYNPESPNPYHYRPHSPGAFGTPSSSTFSTGQNSPRWSGSFQSPPPSGHSRSHSLYSTPHTPSRRLSVPSPSYPYPPSRGTSYGLPQTMNSPMMSPSMLSSPTSSGWGRRDSVSAVGAEAYKRKTWAHPEPYSPFASRVQEPDPYRAGAPPAPSHGPVDQGQMRLPGIESFDSLPRPTTPVYRQSSPMAIDTPSRPPVLGEPYHEERRGSQQWETGAPRSFPDRFDSAGAWASEANWAVQARAEQARGQPSQVRFEDPSYQERSQQNAYHHQSAPVVTPREAKRQAWYQGPVAHPQEQQVVDPQLQRTSPEGSSSSEGIPGTPSSSTARDSNPSIVHANGYVENQGGFPMHDPRAGSSNDVGVYTHYPPAHNPDAAYTYAHGQQPPQAEPQDQQPKAADSSMLRLEALVAVATSEENVAATAC